MQAWGPRGVFALTAIFPLVVSAAAVLIDEAPAPGPRFKPDGDYLSAPSAQSSSNSMLSPLAANVVSWGMC